MTLRSCYHLLRFGSGVKFRVVLILVVGVILRVRLRRYDALSCLELVHRNPAYFPPKKFRASAEPGVANHRTFRVWPLNQSAPQGLPNRLPRGILRRIRDSSYE